MPCCVMQYGGPRGKGVLAQLVERLNGIEEVRGSNPLGSTSFSPSGTAERCNQNSSSCWGSGCSLRNGARRQRSLQRKSLKRAGRVVFIPNSLPDGVGQWLGLPCFFLREPQKGDPFVEGSRLRVPPEFQRFASEARACVAAVHRALNCIRESFSGKAWQPSLAMDAAAALSPDCRRLRMSIRCHMPPPPPGRAEMAMAASDVARSARPCWWSNWISLV